MIDHFLRGKAWYTVAQYCLKGCVMHEIELSDRITRVAQLVAERTAHGEIVTRRMLCTKWADAKGRLQMSDKTIRKVVDKACDMGILKKKRVRLSMGLWAFQLIANEDFNANIRKDAK